MPALETAVSALALANSALDVFVKISTQIGADTDLAFIRDEFTMMQAFLKTADGASSISSSSKRGKVVDAWVRQVRVLAYDVEDCLEDNALHLERRRPGPGSECLLRRLPRSIKARRRIADNIKKLRARVEDVSNRNLRYRLIGGPPISQLPPAGELPGGGGFVADDHHLQLWSSAEQQSDAQQVMEEANLAGLVSGGGTALRVIAVWARGDDGMASVSVVREVYDADLATTNTKRSFAWRAWVKVARPFSPHQLIESLVRQFYANDASQKWIEAESKMMEEVSVVEVFKRLMKDKRYLLVLDDLADAEEWLWIKTYLADYKNGSRVIVRTQHRGIAMLCLERQSVVTRVSDSELNESLDGRQRPVYLMFNKEKEGGSSSSSDTAVPTETPPPPTKPAVDRRDSMLAVLEENRLVGRDQDASNLIDLVLRNKDDTIDGEHYVAVFGASRVGKSALVRSVWQSGRLRGTFDRLAWFTVRYPFNRHELTTTVQRELTAAGPLQIGSKLMMNKRPAAAGGATDDAGPPRPKRPGGKGRNNLVVVDDVSSKDQLDRIKEALQAPGLSVSRVIVITKEPSVAQHFHSKDKYELLPLQQRHALELFNKKLEKVKVNLQDKMLSKIAEEIVKKCGGLPQIISTIAGYLQDVHPKEWRKFCDHMSSELVNKPELKDIDRMLTAGYKNLPPNLKSCFLYMSVFPEDDIIRKKRIVRRWIAEGYSNAKHGTRAEQVAHKQFHDLISRNMIQPSGQETFSFGFQNLMHGVSRKKSAEENLVLVLDKDEHSLSLQAKSRARHLTVMEDWSREGKKSKALENIVDLYHIRSMTVFGKFKSFFISKKMKLLRVLDLEGTIGIRNCDLSPIGKLRHLRYLSLRGTDGFFRLPASIGNLHNLETLDVRDTPVTKLPLTIVKLQKLKYLRAGIIAYAEDVSEVANIPYELRQNWTEYFTNLLLRKEAIDDEATEDSPSEDFRFLVPYTCFSVNVWLRGLDPYGVEVPRQIGKLRALQTLGVVNVARGKNVLEEIEKLTQLRKLGLTGIKTDHCKELESAISSLSHLQTLSMRAEGNNGLVECLDGISPPEDLQSLKLYGNLGELPRWHAELRSLTKLTLRSTLLKQDAVQEIGELPNLTSLRLLRKSFKGEELHFHSNTFASLLVLEIDGPSDTKTVKFEKETMAGLKLLKVKCWWNTVTGCCSFTGILHLPNLMEFLLNGLDCGEVEESFQDSDLEADMSKEFEEWIAKRKPLWVKNRALKEDLLNQLEGNQKRHILKMEC